MSPRPCSSVRRTPTRDTHPLSLHDALPILLTDLLLALKLRAVFEFYIDDIARSHKSQAAFATKNLPLLLRSEEHTSELQSLRQLVCRLLLEKKNGGDKPRSSLLTAWTEASS